jgi:hypothetical protein
MVRKEIQDKCLWKSKRIGGGFIISELTLMEVSINNKIGTVYSLEYTKIPKVLLISHHG